MKLDDKWLDKIAQKVEAYEEQAPAPDWSLIQADIEKELTPSSKKVIPMVPRNKWWAVAAALFLGILSYGVYTVTHTTVLPDDSVQIVAEDSYLKTILPQIQTIGEKSQDDLKAMAADAKIDSPHKTVAASIGQRSNMMAYQGSMPEEEDHVSVGDYSPEQIDVQDVDVIQMPSPVATPIEQNSAASAEVENEKEEQVEYDDLYGNVDYSSFIKSKKSRLDSGGNGFGVAMGSGGAFNVNGVTADQTVKVLQEINIENFTSSSSKNLERVTMQNGIPYAEKEIKQKEYDHNQPISFGLSYRKPLTDKFSLETGLTYTYLSSTVKDLEGSAPRSYKQKLHYMGVPVKLNWSFYERNRFSFYASAGGAVDFAIAGKIDGESKRPTRPQFSVAGGVGAQFAISKNVGFYLEPGVAYFFNDGSKIETIRKEKPFNFNLSTGFRLTF